MAKQRSANITRKTNETDIEVSLNLDGIGSGKIASGIPFFDHMLELFSKHGFFDLNINAKGDIDIDYHHLVEDMGITLGQAFKKALGDKSGIKRYGFFILPMDETLVTVALDLSNRAFLVYEANTPISMVRDFNILLFKEFFQAFANEAGCNLHIILEHGKEPHHIAEAMFKGFAKALDLATQVESRLDGGVPSTKGTLST
jgi:imidazoleglycerol-phosphate dehydratase